MRFRITIKIPGFKYFPVVLVSDPDRCEISLKHKYQVVLKKVTDAIYLKTDDQD